MGAWDNIASLPAGHVPSAADFSTITSFLAADLEFKVIVKPGDSTIASSTTMTNDADLVFPLAANGSYFCFGKIGYAAAATPQIKVGWTVPSGAGFKWIGHGLDPGVTAAQLGSLDVADRSSSTPTLGVDGTANPNAFTPFLAVQNGVNAGNLQFQWAQATSNATGSLVKNGSWLILVRYA